MTTCKRRMNLLKMRVFENKSTIINCFRYDMVHNYRAGLLLFIISNFPVMLSLSDLMGAGWRFCTVTNNFLNTFPMLFIYKLGYMCKVPVNTTVFQCSVHIYIIKCKVASI